MEPLERLDPVDLLISCRDAQLQIFNNLVV